MLQMRYLTFDDVRARNGFEAKQGYHENDYITV